MISMLKLHNYATNKYVIIIILQCTLIRDLEQYLYTYNVKAIFPSGIEDGAITLGYATVFWSEQGSMDRY